MPPLPPVTKALMLICTAIFCVMFLLPGIGNLLEVWFGLWPLGSGLFLPWQVVTYAFLHGGYLHLFMNMLGLWMIGAEMERLWGDKRYIQFLVAGVLAAAVTQLLITWLTGARTPTVGISGAIFALLLAYGMLFPNRTVMLIIPPIPMKARTLVLVFGAIELFMGFIDRGGVAHFAHLGGMVGGFLMIRYWRGQSPFSRRRGDVPPRRGGASRWSASALQLFTPPHSTPFRISRRSSIRRITSRPSVETSPPTSAHWR
jgi:membrane associated rhomboid family serine protease